MKLTATFCTLCNKEMEIGTLLTWHLITEHPYKFLDIFYKYYTPSETGVIDKYFEVREI
jgi:hypothetical protein